MINDYVPIAWKKDHYQVLSTMNLLRFHAGEKMIKSEIKDSLLKYRRVNTFEGHGSSTGPVNVTH